MEGVAKYFGCFGGQYVHELATLGIQCGLPQPLDGRQGTYSKFQRQRSSKSTTQITSQKPK